MREATLVRCCHACHSAISIHASHAGGDFPSTNSHIVPRYFNPRLPCGRRLISRLVASPISIISIHASHAGGDAHLPGTLGRQGYFNPRLPCGRRPNQPPLRPAVLYFNPRLPCGRRHDKRDNSVPTTIISIHASHAGGDRATLAIAHLVLISIHASHAGGDVSTCQSLRHRLHFNPRLPCGRRHRRA